VDNELILRSRKHQDHIFIIDGDIHHHVGHHGLACVLEGICPRATEKQRFSKIVGTATLLNRRQFFAKQKNLTDK